MAALRAGAAASVARAAAMAASCDSMAATTRACSVGDGSGMRMARIFSALMFAWLIARAACAFASVWKASAFIIRARKSGSAFVVQHDADEVGGKAILALQVEEPGLADVLDGVGAVEKHVAAVEPVDRKYLGGNDDVLHLPAIDHAPAGDFVHAEDFVADRGFVHRLVEAVLHAERDAIDRRARGAREA